MTRRNIQITEDDKPTIDNRDAALIRLCCEIRADYAAYHAAGDADPCGNNTNGGPVGRRYLERAQRQTRAAASISALTVHGLSAKATAVQAAMDDEAGCFGSVGEKSTLALMASLLADTVRIAKEVGEVEWEDKRAAKHACKPVVVAA